MIGATFKNSGAAGFFKGNLLNVIRTIPSKSIQFWACACFEDRPLIDLLHPTVSDPSVS